MEKNKPLRVDLTIENLTENLKKQGIEHEDDIDSFAALFTMLTTLREELGYCISISSTKEKIEKIEDFELTFKNLKTNNRFDLKTMLAITAGIKIKKL